MRIVKSVPKAVRRDLLMYARGVKDRSESATLTDRHLDNRTPLPREIRRGSGE